MSRPQFRKRSAAFDAACKEILRLKGHDVEVFDLGRRRLPQDPGIARIRWIGQETKCRIEAAGGRLFDLNEKDQVEIDQEVLARLRSVRSVNANPDDFDYPEDFALWPAEIQQEWLEALHALYFPQPA